MHNIFLSILKQSDNLLAGLYISLFQEKQSLITVLFHGLFNDQKEIDSNVVYPQQAITTKIFQEFIDYFTTHGYHFVSPDDILKGLDPNKNHILITFDDGYYNNQLALPILEKYKVPALFFISANHIIDNKSFWWDVIYRERVKDGASEEQIAEETIMLKQKKNDEIEAYIIDIFGQNALQPVNNIDRPFTPSELKKFSEHPLVFLGNHTSNHAILTNYTSEEIRTEIITAQESIINITGITPNTIAYPNGNFTPQTPVICKELGLKLGITIIEQKNYLPLSLDTSNAFLLKRFILWGDRSIEKQCAAFRSDIQLMTSIKKFIKRRKHENSMSY